MHERDQLAATCESRQGELGDLLRHSHTHRAQPSLVLAPLRALELEAEVGTCIIYQ